MTSPPIAAGVAEMAPAGRRSLFSSDEWEALGQSLRLSNREIQILACVFDGETEARMGQYRKLDVSSRCELLIRVFAQHLATQRKTHEVRAAR